MATKIAKKLAGAEEAAKSHPALSRLFNSVKSKMLKAEVRNVYTLEQYADEFPIERCLSSGLPLLDLNMMSNDDKTEWGLPCSRWTEVSGIENIGKTLLCHHWAADALKKGGLVFWIQSEGEFDASHAKAIHAQCGVEDDESSGQRLALLSAMSIEDLYVCSESIVASVEEYKQEWEREHPNKPFRKHSPPILVVVDSFASVMSSIDRGGIEEKGWEKRSRMGSKASEFHSYFQIFLNKFAELGIAGVGTNHLRASMDAYGPDTVAAHDSALKYYMSLRMVVDKHPRTDSKYYEKLTKPYTKNGRRMIAGHPVRVTIKKKRGIKVEDGVFELPFYNGFGFDFYYSLLDACITSGVIRIATKGIHKFEPTRKEIKEDEIFKELLSYLPDGEKTVFTNMESARAFLIANEEVSVACIRLCYKFGPEPPPDTRASMKRQKGDDEEDE